MRKSSIALTILLVVVLTLSVAGCGTAEKAGAGATPQELLAAALDPSYEPTAATGGFAVEVSVDADESQIPTSEMDFAKPLVDNGVSVSGTYAVADDPMAVELSASGQIAGNPLDVGLKLAGSECWIRFADAWYTVPSLQMAMATTYLSQIDPQEISDLLADLGFDPASWFEEIQVAGEEELGGVPTVHLAGTLDVMKIVNDISELMKSEELLALIDPTGSLTPDMLSGSGFPTGTSEIEEMRNMVESMLSGGPAVEFWLDKDTSMVRKVALTAHISPPAGEDPEGLLGIDVSAQIWIDTVDQPLQVEPPASSHPLSELQTAVEDSGLFDFFN